MVTISLKIVAVILIADFLSGLIHWWEDTYGNPNWKYIGKTVIEPNLVHHKKPREMVKGNYWKTINSSVAGGVVLAVFCYFLGILSWYSVATLLIATQGNTVHKLAHQTDKENGKFIHFLQKTGILQSRKHHGSHHKAPYDCRYCTMTNFVNPILDHIGFWKKLEWLILKCTGIKILRGDAVRNGL